ncbi:Fibrous sheath-interacting protein 2 [Manis javanica]|nr:Fibrous sheath-interacting protein 2 [Manis javanica]
MLSAKKEGRNLTPEPIHYFTDRIRSSSSYNQENLISYAGVTEDSKKIQMPEPDIVDFAIKFADCLTGELRKSEIKVLPNAEEVFSFPPIDKETVDKIPDFVHNQFIANYGSNDVQKDDKNNIAIEMLLL